MDPKQKKSQNTFQSEGTYGSNPETSRGSFRREPPVVPERVAVLKANYKQAWLYFLIIVSLIVAWGGVIRFALMQTFAVDNNQDVPRTSETFVAIAYEGISESEFEVTPKVFAEQIDTLEEAGYNAISLQDVKAFYEDGTLLPEKALLLTFDHSRKSSYFDARRVLKDYGWRAVMFVWTKPILNEDPAALRWPYIRAMINSGSWEAGAQSQQGFERIPTDREGTLRNFLTTPQWLSSENRYETPREFEARLRKDHEFVFNLIKEETNRDPIAFAFPYGDFGQFDERALLTRQLNMDLVDEYYDLGFVLGNAALNTRFSNPNRLNRLLVQRDWSGEDLLARLEAARPQELGTSTEKLLSEEVRWQHDWGLFTIEDDTLRLEATPDNTGAKVWINGTDLYRDFRASFVMKLNKGQAGIFLRASKDGESHLYLGMGYDGEVWLRQKMPGMESITLGTSRFEKRPDGTVHLELFSRDNQLFASISGSPLFDEVILTRGANNPGMVGLSVWDPEVGTADLEVLEVNVETFHNRIVTWDPIPAGLPNVASWMNENGYKYTILSPPWLRFGLEGRSEQVGWDPVYYADLAQVYNMEFGPEVIIERSDSLDLTTADGLATMAWEQGAAAVYFNLSDMLGGLNIARVTNWLEKMSAALTERNIRLIVSLPKSLEQGNTIPSLLEGLDNLNVVLKEGSDANQHGLTVTNPRAVSWNHAIIREPKETFSFELQDIEDENEGSLTDIRSRVLLEQGLEAFNKGDFALAIDLWNNWSDLEPYNEKPYRFLGDVYQRTQNYLPAIDNYRKSLELNPGQISLVISTAKLLNKYAKDSEEALEMLNLYGRLFPENTRITLAQAELLLQEGNQQAAGRLIREVVDSSPQDLTALSLLHDLLPTASLRVKNLQKILEIGRQLGMYRHFADSISYYNLLVWPESWRLLGLVAARADQDHPDAAKYKALLPRETVVRESFKFDTLSDEWTNTSVSSETEGQESLYLSANPTGTEASLRLKRSEMFQSGFIEAQLDDARGFFWLYARRSEGNMIRFGYQSEGKLYLQIWMDDEVVVNLNRGWVRPRGGANMRLEIRGESVMGYIDGKPAFGAPTQVPKNMQLGWWGMAPWAAEFGVAQAVVKEIAGGPLPVKIGIFDPTGVNWTDDSIVNNLKRNLDSLSMISPAWFFQDTSGTIKPRTDLDYPRTRLMSRYYKIRLFPMVLSAISDTLDIQNLVSIARASKLDGFTLSFLNMPGERWFESVENQLIGTGIGLVALHVDEDGNLAEIRELGDVQTLQSGPRRVRDYPIIDLTGKTEPVLNNLEPDPTKPMADSDQRPSLLSDPVESKVYIF